MVACDVLLVARRRAGLTQRQLASRMGCPQSTIGRWETGAREPRFAEVSKTRGLAVARPAAGRAGFEPRAARRWLPRRCTIDQIVHRREGEREAREALSAHLDQIAAEMAADCELPLELPALCRELGIGLRVDRADGRRRGALMRVGRGWEVVLMRNHGRPAPISAHERFTIAHELGHYVLVRDTTFRARREADYWLGEELCNRFASKLLIPERALAGLGEPGSSQELAASVCAVARQAGVTFEPAARALVELTSAPVAIGTFRLDPFLPTRRLGFRGWWVENRAWWGARGGRRLAVYADHALAPVLLRMRAMSAGETASPALLGACSTRLRRSGGTAASFTALLASA